MDDLKKVFKEKAEPKWKDQDGIDDVETPDIETPDDSVSDDIDNRVHS